MPRIDNPYECANYNEKVQNLNQTCKKGYNYGRCILYEDVLSCPEFKKKYLIYTDNQTGSDDTMLRLARGDK